MIKFFLESASAVFFALALITFTASAFTFTWPVTVKWLLLGVGFAAIGGGAQLLLLFFSLIEDFRPLAQRATSASMSALTPKADMCGASKDVR